MSTPIEFEPPARQDFGPTTSASNFEPLLVHKLAGSMSIPSIDVPTQAMPSDISSEPDSTFRSKPDEDYDTKIDEYIITDSDARAVDSDVAACESYTVLEREDSDDGSYTVSSAVTPTIVQSLSKLPQSYTLNVDATVTSIATIQSAPCVSSSSQMLLLPTILATGAPIDSKPLDGTGSPTAISQIILTSDAYTTSFNQPVQRTNILPETNLITRPKPAKVQILSNISLPKTTSVVTYSPYVSTDAPLYNTSEQVYKLNTGVATIHSKHLNHSTVGKAKNPASVNYPNMTSTVISQAHIKTVGYTHTNPKAVSSKSLNKVNNGSNATVGSVIPPGTNQCHILSRVVSGPKLAVQPGRKGLNTFSKSVKSSSQNTISGSAKSQSRSIKIMQQSSVSKTEIKSWNIANANANTPATYSVEVSGKPPPQKSSPPHKSNHPLLAQKSLAKNEQRVVLQSPCGPVLISTAPISVSHHRPSHYVQSGTPSLRYVHNYVQQPTEVILPTLATSNQISANQHLTAQILQSLSQPIGIAQPCPPVINPPEPFVSPPKPVQHRRHISGDPTTLLMADDFIGMEEKPNLSEEIIRYTHDTVAFVMLDHTYALSAQKLSPVPTNTSAIVASVPPILSPVQATAPPSPIKGSPPAVSSTVQINDYHIASSTGPPLPSSPIATVPSLGSFTYKSTVLPPKTEDDDAASAISSTDGRAVDRAGSDTETAPEVDDGKTRCICDFTHDDGYMICCDRCGEWQHVDCMGIDRNNIPDAYQCNECQPRKVERRIARALQMRKREEFGYHGSGSESSDGAQSSGMRRKRLLTVTTYSDTSGACITTYNNLPVPPPQQSLPQPKRIPVRRPKKTDIIRKGSNKRKLTEKRVKRKKDMMMNRSKYSSLNSSQPNWHDTYEQAATNHYSPELRAKIMRYGSKVANTPNMTQAISAHYCTTVPHAGGKILIATRDLQENTPIVELRGKYMLSTQHRPQLQVSSRVGGQKPGPFVFFYRLPKDNTQVCIDTRTYGNEARFVRRSCKYNAELQHCIVKGTLHVYIVSLGSILDGTEITVPHDHSGGKQACACGNPKHCKLNGFNTLAARKAPADYQPREKRSRHRRSSSSSAESPQESPPSLPAPRRLSVINTNIKSPIKLEMASPIKTWGTTFTDAPISESIFKEEKIESEKEEDSKPMTIKSEDAVDSVAPIIKLEMKEEVKKEEIEPPKPKADDIKHEIVEEFIKEQLPPSPVKEIKEEKKVAILPEIEIDNIPMPEGPPPKIKEEEKVTRSVTAKPVGQERATRSSRSQSITALNHDSMDEKTDDSQDKQQSASKEKRKMTREERKMEAIMRAFERMEKAEQRKQEVRERQSKRRESDPVPPTDKDGDEEEPATGPAAKKRRQRRGRARTTSQNTSRRRLNSADSDLMTSGDEPHTSPVRDLPTLQAQPIVTSTTQDVNLSSACRLVEAAVGPLESAFKLPKTKKTMANEWLGRSPEHTPYQSYRSPLMSERSLESLVRVASTMIGDLGGNTSELDEGSPPRTSTRDKNRPPKKMKRGTSKAVVPEQPVVPIPQHSAKKRWLRQAISEESDSPTAESPPNEMVTPLKKRRLARESLSLDQPVIHKPEEASPPVTGSEDSPTKEDVCDSITRHCKMKSRYIDSMFGSEYSNTVDPQNVFLNLKNPRDEKFNLDIRRIIGVPGTEETYEDIPLPKTPEERLKPIDVNENEFQHNTVHEEDKIANVTPMEIDTDISTHLITDLTEDTTDGKTEPDGQNEPITIHSNDTSGNSSPLHDEMDDIQKKIHSFHTENIQILKIRNKKAPKEKRKKVNLNFDLNMVDDQISIQLRTDASPRSEDMNGDVNTKTVEPIIVTAPDLIPLPPPVDSSKTNANFRFIPWMAEIPLPAEPMRPKTPESVNTLISEDVASESVKVTPDPDEVITDAVKVITDCSVAISEPTTETPVLEVTPETVKVMSESIVVTDPIEVQSDSVKVQPDAVGMVVACVEASYKTSPESRVQVSPAAITSPTISPQKTDQIIISTSEVVQTQNSFVSTGLFSGIFNNMNSTVTESMPMINESVPHLNIINTISKNIEGSVFNDRPLKTACDELRNVQEILDRVNSMDANTSVILSGVLNADVASKTEHLTPMKTYCPRSNDPRLNPPATDKPKPVRRKLSITEYLKRHKVGGTGDCEMQHSQAASDSAEGTRAGEWSSDSSAAGSRSPLRLDAIASSASDEMEMRLTQALKSPLMPISARVGGTTGEFDAQPTQLERQRENLSQRLRREFGLSLPEDEEARSATALQGADMITQSLHSEALTLEGSSFSRPPVHTKPPRLDR